MRSIEIRWEDIKKDLYAYMYGANDILTNSLRKKIGNSLARQMEIRVTHAILGELAKMSIGPDISHDGPCIDLTTADYSRSEQRILDHYIQEWDDGVDRGGRGHGSPTGSYARPCHGFQVLAYSAPS